jgi:hypothetical protein
MEDPTFDIFSGSSRRGARLVEAVKGLSNARERMWQIAEEKPGCYFIFSSRDDSILIKIETFLKSESLPMTRDNKVRKAHA